MKISATVLLFFFWSISADAQKPAVLKFKDLQKIIAGKTDSTYVINFWATWCKPCVEELPSFLKIENEFKDKKIRFIYVSLNFKREYESALVPYLQKNNMKNEVYLLDEPDYNAWIDKINSKWMGSIPATVIYTPDPGNNYFQEGSFTYETLYTVINSSIP